MKALAMVILCCIILNGCVSKAKYHNRMGDLKAITAEYKIIRKELREIEQHNTRLLDTISVFVAENNKISLEINKRLRKHNVKSNLKASDLESLTLRSSIMTEEDYTYYKKKYPCTDTNNAKNTPWLTEKEKKIYYYVNKARLDPMGFCNTYVVPRIKNDSNNAYLLTLIDYLYEMKPRNALKPD